MINLTEEQVKFLNQIAKKNVPLLYVTIRNNCIRFSIENRSCFMTVFISVNYILSYRDIWLKKSQKYICNRYILKF